MALRERPRSQARPGRLHRRHSGRHGSGWFADLRRSLLEASYEPADVYYVLGDFASYRETKDAMAADYADARAWQRKAWVNITRSGRFSSDRTISDYAARSGRSTPSPSPDRHGMSKRPSPQPVRGARACTG